MPDFDASVAIAIVLVNFPLVSLFVLAQQKGWIVFGKQHDAIVKTLNEDLMRAREQAEERERALRNDYERRIDYMDARRKEEREGRISAEKRVTALSEVTNKMVDLMQDIRVELARVFGNASGGAQEVQKR